jgi:transketolase
MAEGVPTRDGYGEALVELGRADERIVVLEADISLSTRSCHFARAFPDRFFQLGVAEANMFGVAAGLATVGKIPFASTYAVFASMRACEQVRTSIAYPRLNVKIGASHGGLTSGNDGVTHQGTEDLGILSTIPGMTVIMPADYHAAKRLVAAAAAMRGPVYLRFTRDPVPIVYDASEPFTIGKGKLLARGDDVTLVAIGDMVAVALEARRRLLEGGLEADVIDMHTLKPFDGDVLLESASRTRRVVTLEDHQIHGGLGSTVAEVLSEILPTPLCRLGLRDTFAESGEYRSLLHKYHLDAEAVVAAVAGLWRG